MVARTSTWKGSPEALQRWAEHVKTYVKPFVAGLPGNAGELVATIFEEQYLPRAKGGRPIRPSGSLVD